MQGQQEGGERQESSLRAAEAVGHNKRASSGSDDAATIIINDRWRH